MPPTAVRATLAARAGGGWGFTMSRTARDSVDATASVIEGLRAAGVPASDPALRAAAAWMLAQRNAAGGPGVGRRRAGPPTPTPRRARSAPCARWAARPPPATRAALRALQEADGGFRFTRAAAGSRLLATNDAVPALAGSLAAGALTDRDPAGLGDRSSG